MNLFFDAIEQIVDAAEYPRTLTRAESDVLALVDEYGNWMWDSGYMDNPSGETLAAEAQHKLKEIRDAFGAALNNAYAEGRKDESEWQPIETCPEDENVLVATTGGWVDTAFWTDESGEGRKWWWLVSANKYAEHPIHPNLIPTHWMPLPKHPAAA